ncbi:MAG: hypothetical protein ABR874_07085 [Candidatus Sulfotelmatobacter sp.]|jgi:hypothetical protein
MSRHFWSRHSRLLSLFAVATIASSVLASAQVQSSPTDATLENPGTSPAAFVYVSSSPSSNTYQINAYAASTNGRLTVVPGSPFSTNAPGLASSSKYIFGTNGVEIDSFAIADDGAIAEVSSINAQQLNQGDCGGPFDMFVDRTGATLYDMDYIGNICANNPYQSFSVGGDNGDLSYIGATAAASPAFATSLGFLANNKYAYGSSCLFIVGPLIYGFERTDDNSLSELNTNPAMPAAPAGDYYCPGGAAAPDAANHLAFVVTPMNGSNQQPTGGPAQISVYTADGSGNLTTNSTYENMPAAVSGAYDFKASPAGKYLAVGGPKGLQLFHFNGANPLTRFTALLPTGEIDQLAWDSDDHLYAIGIPAGQLYVLAVTSTGVREAPGSPYSITNPQSITVVPR